MTPPDEHTQAGFLFDLSPSIDAPENAMEDDREPLDYISDSDGFEWVPPIRSVPDEDRESFIRLSLVNGVGPRLLAGLVDHFGSADAALKATLSQLGQVPRIGPKLSTLIRDSSQSDLAERVFQHCKEHNVQIIIAGDSEFPRLLAELTDPPVMLFVRGEFQKTDQLSIAIVGTRHCTNYGRTMAERISKALARYGITIVSGLARGIDAICHRGAIDANGRTIAVLGSSVTDIYPPEHKELAEQVVEHGVLISETHPFSKPKAGVFPQRNRIISGLSLGTIVVEAADRSGSLITARHAGEQGRDLFAIPGAATSRMSRGCNQLIRDGAILIQDAEDVIEHLGPLVEKANLGVGNVVHHAVELQLNEIESAVLQAIDCTPTDVDQVISTSKLPVPRVLSTLSVLAMRGLIQRLSGRTVVRR
ncbi:MAG TPA: DNA-processing protein DprA [Pirellula sp.]|nr:DNA-processing protein DprA [Pirellula sp.]